MSRSDTEWECFDIFFGLPEVRKLRAGLLDEDAAHVFTSGHCHSFVEALRRLTAAELIFAFDGPAEGEQRVQGHVMARIAGRCLDARGWLQEPPESQWERVIEIPRAGSIQAAAGSRRGSPMPCPAPKRCFGASRYRSQTALPPSAAAAMCVGSTVGDRRRGSRRRPPPSRSHAGPDLDTSAITTTEEVVMTTTAGEQPFLERLPFPAHIEHAYTPRETGSYGGRDHVVVEEEVRIGRIRRNRGDALCKTRWAFWGLNRGGEDHEPSCVRCIEIAERAIADPARVGRREASRKRADDEP